MCNDLENGNTTRESSQNKGSLAQMRGPRIEFPCGLIYVNPAVNNQKNPEENVRANSISQIEKLIEEGNTVIGLEMTIRELAERCSINIDPQHTDKNSNVACCEAVIAMKDEEIEKYKNSSIVCCTNRVDLDAIAAFIILSGRIRGNNNFKNNPQVQAIAAADKHDVGSWQASTDKKAFSTDDKIKALAASIKVFKVTSDDINRVRTFIETGEVDKVTLENYKRAQEKIINSIKSGATTREVVNGVAYVVSTLPAAIAVGYVRAPVVVAENPEMKGPNGTYRKITIAQYGDKDRIDLTGLAKALNELEKRYGGTGTWGGSKTIIGSPQGCSSKIPMSEIRKLVEKYKID